MADSEKTRGLNYEAEYEKMRALNNQLAEENTVLRGDLDTLETEIYKLRAQMDVVYLIFGGSK